ncbi:uncharacterized protein LOC121874391 [Homarus americanus]|uniref:uncharacterized protein LOC121874391 n=1 Tax=Homarus americanus TaxID=6706 RepID=UPI001C48E55A|nr:uncharacterized protein LOC121874391 [Homarus americanus]
MPGSGCGEEPGRHYSPGGLPRSPGVTSGPRSNSSRSPAVSSGPWSKSTCPGRSSSDGVMVRGDAWQAGGSTQRTPIEAGRPGNKGSLLERAGMWQQQQARSLALERPWPAEDIPRGSRSPAATKGGVLTSTPWEATVTGEEAVRCSSNSRSPWAAEDPPRCNSRSLGASDGGALRSSGSWSTTEVEEPPRRTTSRYPWGATEGGGGALRSRPPSSTTSCSHKLLLASFLLLASCLAPAECGNPDAKRLYDDLLSNYNKLVRPVVNVTDVLTVMIKLKLSQLIDVVSMWLISTLYLAYLVCTWLYGVYLAL